MTRERTDNTDDDSTVPPAADGDDQREHEESAGGGLVTRRAALAGLGAAGLLGLGTGTAGADPQGQVGTASDPLTALYTEELNGGITGDTALTDLAGSGLAIDAGSLEVSGVSQWTDADANGLLEPSDGTKTGIEVIDVRADSLADNGSGDVSLGNTLDLGGNVITGGAGNGVIVNTDGGSRALELGVPGTDAGGDTAGGNVVAGHPNNTVNNGAVGVVIGGGGATNGNENTVGGRYATVGGGRRNAGSGVAATVGGGEANTASGGFATVGGGTGNTASNTTATVGGGNNSTASRGFATVGGGNGNTASGIAATVGGGSGNTASGVAATVGGGDDNTASGNHSFAAGQFGRAADDNSFVWNDGSGASDDTGTPNDQFSSATSAGSTPTGDNTFHVKATQGVRFITSPDNASRVWIDTNGNVEASGAKNFVERVETDDGERTVTYTALEAPTARTEVSGVATVADGYAEVDLPEHFAWVTDPDEDLVVQVTAHATEAVGPQVTERSTDRLLIEDPGDGPDAYEVSYTVKGTRDGYADKEVVADPDGAREDDGGGPDGD